MDIKIKVRKGNEDEVLNFLKDLDFASFCQCSISTTNKDIIIDNANSNISGGQMEKIIIAQTLLNSGSVIIFDETTNQIDEAEERKILTFIKKYYKDKTVILISHRKGNAQLFDKIISFKNNGVKIKNKEEIDDRINKQRA